MKDTSAKRLLAVTTYVLFACGITADTWGMRSYPTYGYSPYIENMLQLGMLNTQNWPAIVQNHQEVAAAYALANAEAVGMKSITFCEDAASNPYIQSAWSICQARVTSVTTDALSWRAMSAVLSGPARKNEVTELTVMIEPFLESTCKWRDFAKHLVQFSNLKTLMFSGFGPDVDDFRVHYELDIKFAKAFTVLPNTLTTIEFEDYSPGPTLYGVLKALGFIYFDDGEFRR